MPLDLPGPPMASWVLAAAGRWASRADLPAPEHDPERVRRAADDILSRPRYDWDDSSRNVLDRLAEWIAEHIPGLSASGAGGSLPSLIGWLLLAGLAALVAVLIYRFARGRSGRPRTRRSRRRAGTVVVDESEALVDWEAEAVRAEAEGRWRDGLRCRYRALVVELAGRHVITELVGRTAGEFSREVAAGRPEVAPAFSAATDLFEWAWYGGAATGAEERDRFAALADEVLAGTTSPRGREEVASA